MDKILLFTDTPIFENHKLSNKEMEQIKSSIKKFELKGDFKIVDEAAISKDDFRECISKDKYSILHFTNSSNNSNGIKVRSEDDLEKVEYISKEDFQYYFNSLNEHTVCVILTGKSTEKLAAELAQFVDFSIGTISDIEESEAISFSKKFYKYLTKRRIICDRTILNAFYEGIQQALILRDEYQYVLFTKKITSNTMEEKQSPAVQKIKDQDDYQEIITTLNQLEQKRVQIETIESKIPDTHLHKKMTDWLDTNLEVKLKEVVQIIKPEISARDQRKFLLDMRQFMRFVRMALITNNLNALEDHGVRYEFEPDDYKSAFKLLEKNIPKKGSYLPVSRYFLKEILEALESLHI